MAEDGRVMTLLEDFARGWADSLNPPTRLVDVMVDIDDVLFPWADTVHEKCGELGIHDGSRPWTSWSMWEDYGVPKEVWLDAIADATLDGMYHKTPPFPGSVEALRRLHWAGHRIHLVTARGFAWTGDKRDHSEQIRQWTPEWIEEFAVPRHTLTFAKDKVAAQEEVGARWDYAIDDGGHNFEDLFNAGVNVYLLDRPHNQNISTAGRRVRSVEQFVEIILRETA